MKKLLLFVVAVMALTTASAQKNEAPRIALKSNLLSLPLGNLNLGSEFRLAEHWSLAADVTFTVYNIWGDVPYGAPAAADQTTTDNLDGYYTNGWSGFLEARYYFCKALHGHHLGLYAMGGRYGRAQMDGGWQSILISGGLENRGVNAYVTSVGISYGYSFKFGESNNNYWGLDLYIGGGLFYANYASALRTENQHNQIKNDVSWSLMKTGIALSYTF